MMHGLYTVLIYDVVNLLVHSIQTSVSAEMRFGCYSQSRSKKNVFITSALALALTTASSHGTCHRRMARLS